MESDKACTLLEELEVALFDLSTFLQAMTTHDAWPREDMVSQLLAPSNGQHYLGVAHKRGGLLTTSINLASGLHVGLHVDSFDGAALIDRATSRRRFALNLGPGARYLLVAQTSLEAMAELAGWEVAEPPSSRKVSATMIELRVPCLRIEMRPGDAYLVATEYVVHDGSSIGQTLASNTAHWLGHWEVGPLFGPLVAS